MFFIEAPFFNLNQSDFFLAFALQFRSVLRIVLELIDKFIDNIPKPLIRELEIYGDFIFRVNDVVEHFAIVVERLNAILVAWSVSQHIHMTKVKF